MPLFQAKQPFNHHEWIFEVKYDGFRALAYLKRGAARLVSRKGNVYRSFRELCAWMGENLKTESAILDGELVCVDGAGRPIFNDLLYRRGQPCFFAFDLLWLNNQDTRELPLMERKRLLQSIVPSNQLSRMQLAGHVPERGVDVFNAACRMDLEGIVAKWRRGPYTAEASSWIKIKNPHYSQAKGRREQFELFRSPRYPVGSPPSSPPSTRVNIPAEARVGGKTPNPPGLQPVGFFGCSG